MPIWTGIVIIGGLILQVFVPGFPKETLLLQSGISYGLVWGSLVNWLGMVIGAQVGYEVTRHSFTFSSRYLSLVDSYKESSWFLHLEKHGNTALFVFRLLPFAPNDILSLVSGVLLLPRRGFLLVSMTTAIPYAIIFAYFGDIGAEWISAQLLLVINLALMGISVIVYVTREWVHHSQKMQKPSDDQIFP